jgi:phospholipid:diacylglycerol acyltransferase
MFCLEAYQRMLASNWSFGIERDQLQIEKNDNDPSKWTNPLETRLPNAPSMRIFCLYGHGKPTERRSGERTPPVSIGER